MLLFLQVLLVIGSSGSSSIVELDIQFASGL